METGREYVELAELQRQVREGLAERFPGKVWVRAEIREWSPRANGHCYLSLTQTKGEVTVAEARAMIWRSRYGVIKDFFEKETGSPLGPGITVLARVQVSFHEVYGYSLVIDDIDPAFTAGEQALRKKRTLERLAAEGYIDLQQELALPPLPRRLAVVSSPTAAGYGDFRRHLADNAYGFRFEVELFEALMQGEAAPASIIDALGRVDPARFDAVLILRGGGSELDLACFDDYGLAVAIATCPLPVVTAIGHDRDVHVADQVANTSVKTPTALADLFLDCFVAEDEAVGALCARIRAGLVRRVDALEGAAAGLRERIRYGLSARIGLQESRLSVLEARIVGGDPRGILRRGYVLVTDGEGKVLKSAAAVRSGAAIGVRFADGTLEAIVNRIVKE